MLIYEYLHMYTMVTYTMVYNGILAYTLVYNRVWYFYNVT